MTEIFYGLAILACPVGMGVMMWMMMRGGKDDSRSSPDREDELAQLRAEVDQLRAAQQREGQSRAAAQAPTAGPPPTQP